MRTFVSIALVCVACGPPPPPQGGGADAGADPCANLKDPGASEQVTFTGRFLAADGSPRAAEEVGLWSGSLSCFDPLWFFFGADSPDATATTDAQGRYSIAREWRQTKSIFGSALCFTITARNQSSWGVFQQSGRTQAQFYANQLPNDVPVLRDWDEAATTGSADPIALGWNALEKTHPWPASRYTLTVLSSGRTVWTTQSATPGLPLPRYLLEDFAALTWAPRAAAKVPGSCTTFDLSMSGKGMAFTNPAPSAPPSRQAACATDLGPLASPCGATDGKLDAFSLAPSGSSGQRPARIDLTLASAAAVKRVVIRGLLLQLPDPQKKPRLDVLVSADGAAFTPALAGVELGGSGYSDLALPQAATVKAVRLQLTDAKAESVAELSLMP